MSNKSIIIFSAVILGVLTLSRCISNPVSASEDIRGKTYAGSAACKKCHQDIYNAFLQTAHFNTSQPDVSDEVRTGFEKGKNVFEFNDSIKVIMNQMHNHYSQTEYRNGQSVLSHTFDITIGSGRKAQSFLYYDSGKIFQLPLSYFVSEHSWAISPGFPSNAARFDRSIPSACFGCHSSFVATTKSYEGLQSLETYQQGQIVYGIDCERCHGPAADHVEYYTNHPKEKQIKFITSMKGLTRAQKIDMCALCHSGAENQQQSLFNFKPGDRLSDFYYPDFNNIGAEGLDVHGKQSQLMTGSKCYQMSNNLTCNSCHNVHVKERENIALFSERCMTCHQQVNHSFEKENKGLTALIQTNCVNCHMPLKASKVITLLTKQQSSATPDFIRTHLIKVYPAETKKFLDSLRSIAKLTN